MAYWTLVVCCLLRFMDKEEPPRGSESLLPVDDPDLGRLVSPARLSFPSDRLTIKKLRELWPELDKPGWRGSLFADEVKLDLREELSNLLAWEEALCERAARVELSLSDYAIPDREEEEQTIQDLAKAYQRLGLCTGPKEACEMIRDFQRAAVEQVMVGRGRVR